MDPRMNGYDGCQSSYQGYGYGEQQAYYMDNQGSYHHQQWDNQGMYHQQQRNNNYQDPYSFSSQYQESSSSSNQCQDSDSISELMELLREEKLKMAKNKEIIERMEKVAKQREEDEEVLDVVDEMIESPNDEEHLAHHKDEERIDEECAKGDSNELTPKALDLPKVKESLQTLLGSDDLEEFLSKVEHLKFILENKEMLGEVLQEYEEEQCSSSSMRTMFMEAPSMEKEETIRSKEVLQVEHKVETTKMVRHESPLVVKQRETLQPLKRTKRRKRKKPKGIKDRSIEPKPSFLIFKPLRFVDGKLECKVSSKGRSKPFSKVKILLEPSPKGKEWGTINEAMIKTFGMKLGDRGPLFKSDFPDIPNG